MADEWKNEFLPRLEKSLIYNTLKNKCSGRDSEVVALVDEGVKYACNRTKAIIRHMEGYTLHDSVHLFRVLYIMEELLTHENIKQLSVPELMLLILSAFFHDLGMAPSEKKVMTWKKIWDKSPSFEGKVEKEIYKKFDRYYKARPVKKRFIEKLIENGEITYADTLKANLITKYIRQTHAERAREIVAEDWENKIKYRGTDLTVELAQICYSHNEDGTNLLDLDKDLLCDNGTKVCMPLIGILLRLADILDFDAKRTPDVLDSHLYVRDPISLEEWKKHRSIQAKEITPTSIRFSAKCTHPAIEASIHQFCDLIDQELLVCNGIISKLNDFNQNEGRDISLKFPHKVDREKIKTKKNIQNKPLYKYSKTQFNLSKKSVVDLLMGTKLYGNTEVALRELIQNSIDACLLRQAQEIKWNNNYIPKISIEYYQDKQGKNILKVEDNGTGMDQYIIDNYYSQIGSSFYKSADFFELKTKSKADFKPTSRFGIGILSCFMVSDTLVVDTRRLYAPHKSSDPIKIKIQGQESIFWTETGERDKPGTSTELILREADNPWDEMTNKEFIESVDSIVPNPPFEIKIKTTKEEKVRDENSFKKIKATSLKDFSWNENENINYIDFDFERNGLVGSALVAILEIDNEPVNKVELTSKEIEIEGELFNLEKTLNLSSNCISKLSKSITIDEEGRINEDKVHSNIAKSKSMISLHGIEVPTTLFPSSWEKKKSQAKIEWPIPIIIIVDIGGGRDLDLNSARTEINVSDKWIKFEEDLSEIICAGIKKSVSSNYWDKLSEVLQTESQNEIFSKGLKRL